MACKRWHYSRSFPSARTVTIGAWEDGQFVGAMVFSLGANRHIARPYGLTPLQVCELVRVALTKHRTPVSRILAIGLRMLKQQSPGVRLVVSYADSARGHHGGIYQAGNWIYTGESETAAYLVRGNLLQGKTVTQRYGHARIDLIRRDVDPSAERRPVIKYKYVMPLDDGMRKFCEGLRKVPPKRSEVSHGTITGPAA